MFAQSLHFYASVVQSRLFLLYTCVATGSICILCTLLAKGEVHSLFIITFWYHVTTA